MASTASIPVPPIRVNPSEAARLLGLSPRYLRNKLLRKVQFTTIRPYGYGPGRPIYLLHEEVVAYATGGVQALRDLRKKNTRKAGKK